MRRLQNIFHLGVKELRSLRHEAEMLAESLYVPDP